MNTQGGIKMKAILISIHSQWVELILKFIKKDEIRKGTVIGKAINKLIEEQGVAPMLIYCTKGKPTLKGLIAKSWYGLGGYFDYEKLNGKVVARFNATAEEITIRQDRFKEFTFYETSLDMEDLLKQSCLDYNELDNYLQGEKGTDIHISDLEIFDKPKELSEFKSYKKNIVNTKINGMVFETELDNSLIKAPQSWCYVEVEDEE